MLDIRTVLALTITYSLILGIGIILYGIRRKGAYGLIHMGSGVFIYGIGFIIMSFRDYINEFTTVVVANGLVILGIMFILEGLTRFRKFKTRWLYQNTILLILLVGSFMYYTFGAPNVNIRIIIISSIIILLFSEIIFLFLYKPDKRIAKESMVIGLFFFGAVLVNVVRIIMTLDETPMNTFMSAGLIHSLSSVVFQLIPFVLSIGTFWISNTYMEDELKTLLRTDRLTGLYNRTAVMEMAEKELSMSHRHNLSLGIVMCDADNFKTINDTYGHQVGDVVLQEIAEVLKDNLRHEDIVGRYGGEEFLIVVPGTDGEQLRQLLEKLRETIQESNFQIGEASIQVTLSFGGAVISEGYNLCQAISIADKALYEVKNNGRNAVNVNM